MAKHSSILSALVLVFSFTVVSCATSEDEDTANETNNINQQSSNGDVFELPKITVGNSSDAYVHEKSIQFPVTVEDALSIDLEVSDVEIVATGSASADVMVLGTNSDQPMVELYNVAGNGTLAIRIKQGAAFNANDQPNQLSNMSDAVQVRARKAYYTLFDTGQVGVLSLASGSPCVAQNIPDDSCTAASYPLLTSVGSSGAYEITTTPDDRKVIVSNFSEDSIYVIDTMTDDVQVIGGFNGPISVAVAQDGHSLYVGNFYGSSIDKVDLRTNQKCVSHLDPSDICVRMGSYPIPLGNSKPVDQAAINDRYLAMANHNGQSVFVVDLSDDSEISIPTGQEKPSGIVFSPDGNLAYVTHEGSSGTLNDIVVLDMITMSKRSDIAHSAIRPRGIDYSPTDNLIYFADGDHTSNKIYAINPVTNQMLPYTVDVQINPLGVRFLPNGQKAISANTTDYTLSMIDVASKTEIQTISVGGEALNVAIQKLP